MKAVILCGGKGTRLREETEYKPKPLVDVGGMPIIWHIMKIYSHYGINDFVLCLGYKGDMIKRFFLEYEWMANDFTINLKNRMEWITHFNHELEDWRVTLADTGQESLTQLRVKFIEKFIEEDTFMMTYGDGLADIDMKKLLEYHKSKGKLATITGLHPVSRFGVIEAKNGVVINFREKPLLNDMINGGFMVFDRKIFEMMDLKDNRMLEDSILPKLAEKNQLALFEHKGYWDCMDTFRDYQKLNEIWNKGGAPWKVWK